MWTGLQFMKSQLPIMALLELLKSTGPLQSVKLQLTIVQFLPAAEIGPEFVKLHESTVTLAK